VLPAPGERSAPGVVSAGSERFLAVEGAYDLDESLRFVPFGLWDPTCRRAPGRLWKAARTVEGDVLLCLSRVTGGIRATAWGEGAAWALDRAGALAGLADEARAFAPDERLARALARRQPGLRLARSAWVFDGLAEYILQQRVSFRDAARAHRHLVFRLSLPAPGPPGLRLPLSAGDWLRLDAGELRRAGIDARRGAALRGAARAARHVDSAFDLDRAAARSLLAALPGCGPWTVEITMGFVLGDPDAVPVGDLHLPHGIGRALAAEPRADDARMLELLEPYRGHRFRLIRLLLASGQLQLGRSTRR
jgi:3-methyladenine DNA glycosylase/8-oxoguanine DNA glycosylase